VLDDSEVQRALAIMAHPDDVDFSSAGTVAGWTAQGIHVTYCIVTDGDAGGFDDTITRADMAVLRQREQRAAAAAVGVTDLIFLGWPDGRTVADLELRKAISRVIRQVRPDRCIIQSALRSYQRIYASHPDHLAVGSASMDAIYPDARNPFAYPELLADEGLEAWTVSETWVVGHDQPNHAVDITERFDTKLAALHCHESQLRDPDATDERIRAWNGGQATQFGLPEGSYAEVFLVVDSR
jgi:LmbE family N-acetylglucosaminyl deacetylase